MRQGDVCISLGTSAVVSSVVPHPVRDPSGMTAGFADASGGFLPLTTSLNGAGTFDWAARMLGVDHAGLSDLAGSAASGAGKAVFVPYLRGERTPNLPQARGQLLGMDADFSRAEFARAVMEGVACAVREGLEAMLAHTRIEPRRILLVGGGAASEAFRAILAGILGCPVQVPPPGESAAVGAARQAAWILSGSANPPDWSESLGEMRTYEEPLADGVYQRYADYRNQLYPQTLTATSGAADGS